MADAEAVFQKTLKSIESGQISPLYLLHGEEVYLQEILQSRIEGGLVDPSTADFSLQKLDAEQSSPEEICNAAETLPFMGGRRLVVVRRAELLEGKTKELERVFANPPETACLVLISSALKATSALLKAVQGTGVIVSTQPLKGKALKVAVKRMAARQGLALEGEALELFLERTGGSLRRAASELEKLALNVGGDDPTTIKKDAPETLSRERVAEVVDDGRTDNLFHLSDALGVRNAAKALESLQLLLRRQHYPSVIVSAMARHFFRLLEVRSLLDQGISPAAIPKKLAGSPYFLRKLTDQAQRFSETELRSAIYRLHQVDILLKGSGLPHWSLLERLIFDLCRKEPDGGNGKLRKRRSVASEDYAPAG
jgi:DNA polymerase-3 subunit delta